MHLEGLMRLFVGNPAFWIFMPPERFSFIANVEAIATIFALTGFLAMSIILYVLAHAGAANAGART